MEEELCQDPCVSVTILNSYSLRTALEMVEDVKDGDVEIRFYKDRFIIEEFSDDERKFCNVVIKKKDLHHYKYDPFIPEGSNERPECFSVSVNTHNFVNAMKCDKKQKVVIEVFCSKTSMSCAICFCRDRSGDSMDPINGTFDFNCGTESRIEDPFEIVYKELEPNSVLNEKEIVDNLALFKSKKPIYVKFSLLESGTIKLTSMEGNRPTIAHLPPNPNFPETEDDEIPENDYEISLAYADIVGLMKISKLGQYNIIKVYMTLDYPLLIKTRLLNYGTFSIWYSGN